MMDLFYGLSFVQVVVRVNNLRFKKVWEVNLLLQKLFNNFLSLCRLEGVKTMPSATVIFGLDESS